MAGYYVLRKGGTGSENIRIGNRNFILTEPAEYGHYTNNLVDYMKIVSVEESNGSTDLLKANEQPEEIRCLAITIKYR
jgi:hypothetical protein